MKEWKAPEKVEDLFAKSDGNKFASINSPVAGARKEKALEKGKAPYQLHSIDTPNGIKVNILLEELGVEYDAHKIVINGDQFTSGFVSINPSKYSFFNISQTAKFLPFSISQILKLQLIFLNPDQY